MPYLKQNVRVVAKLLLLFLGIIKILPIFGILACDIRTDPGCRSHVVNEFRSGGLHLWHNLNSRGTITDDCNSFTCPLATLIPLEAS